MATEKESQLKQLIDLLSNSQRQHIEVLLKHQGNTTTDDQLTSLVIASPYPVLQILTLAHDISKFHTERIINGVVNHMCDDDTCYGSSEFISILANLPHQILEASTLHQKLLERLLSSSTCAEEGEQMVLALLARNNSQLLNDFLGAARQRLWTLQGGATAPTPHIVLQLALNERQHFVPRLCQELKDFHCIEDPILRSNMLILKLANEFALGTQTIDELGCIDKALTAFEPTAAPTELQEIQKFFYADFQRLSVLLQFLLQFEQASKTLRVESLLRAPGVLTLIHDHNIECDSEKLLRVIEDTYKWQQQTPALRCIRQHELEVLSYYTALNCAYDVILEQEEASNTKLLRLSSQLRQIRQLSTLCLLIEDIFQLVFLRWEQLQQANNRDSKSTQRSQQQQQHSSLDEEDTDMEEDNKEVAAASRPRKVRRRAYGFICRAPALRAIFSCLKSFVTKKLHTEQYKCGGEKLQKRFQRIMDAITEAQWKLKVLQQLDKSLAQSARLSCRLEPEQLLQLVQMHCYTREKASSDDESRERCNYAASLTRRKSRKQRRAATFSGAPVAPITVDSMLTIEQCRLQAHMMLAEGQEQRPFAGNSIMLKMLCSPEELALMALAMQNFSDVKQIIDTFKLQESQLSRELQFMERQQQLKQKLTTIYNNYLALSEQQLQSSTASSSTSTVEQIKSVAAKGFELSKLISVVDNFAQAQRLEPSGEQQQLLQRYSANTHYGFLEQFQAGKLNALLVTDIIINLRFNHEITCNLLLLIRRQQHVNSREGSVELPASSTKQRNVGEATQLPSDIGAMPMLQNLCQCMRLLERHGQQPALNDLLNSHCYVLKPHRMAVELQREDLFKVLYGMSPADYGNCRELRAHMPHFQQLKSQHNYYARFCAYVQQLGRLLQLRHPRWEYHTTELLEQDPYTLIGELVYKCDVTPMEIEQNVSALNLNLVHVLALNICPQFSANGEAGTGLQCPAVQPSKQTSILNYIGQHNQLLACLLQAILAGEMTDTAEGNLNFAFLQQLVQLPEVTSLAQLYDGNVILAALRAYSDNGAAIKHLDDNPKVLLEILLLRMTGRKESEEQQRSRINTLIKTLIAADARNIELAVHISDVKERSQLLVQYFTQLRSTELARDLIERTLQNGELIEATSQSDELRSKLQRSLADITVYARVSDALQLASWQESYELGRQAPNGIFEHLLKEQQFELCLDWCQVLQLTSKYTAQQRILEQSLLNALLREEDEVDEHLLRIVELFPPATIVKLLETYKDKFRSLPLLQWTLDFLSRNASDASVYWNQQMALVMCREIAPEERKYFWHLLRLPLLIVEQLIMNAKFELLGKVLEKARAALDQRPAPHTCSYCFDKRGHVYDLQVSRSQQRRFQLGQQTSEAFILLNFNLYQQDHVASNDCFDLLLRIYASKALDYHIADAESASSMSTEALVSLDSICGTFRMPDVAPARELWTRDEDATHCMCCRRAAFTMLMRRHHCRRCGRVVCYACSTHRMRIAELYAELEVRVCNECHEQSTGGAVSELHPVAEVATTPQRRTSIIAYKWRISGIITHDKLLREEFGYEHAPNVALSLSILRHHLGQSQCVELLLFHCLQLEKLIVPNPEVDYELLAKMMNCLALAAKVRGAPAEFETIRQHSEIILAVVQNGCESMVPPGPLNNHNRRKLADALVEAEHWDLALEFHLKCGFPTTGVRAAHGLACLRAGCYDGAREKFAHCMHRISDEDVNKRLYKQLFTLTEASGSDTSALVPPIKRPKRGPALLQEILQLIAANPTVQPQPETLRRASLMRTSNTSLASLFSRRRAPYVQLTPLREPAINVIDTLANLKHIVKGNYGETSLASTNPDSRRQSRDFEESMHYVLTYGSHADILHFLMERDELRAALKYWQQQHLDLDLFIQYIFQPSLAAGQLPQLVEFIKQLDDARLRSWRVPLLQTCRHLEQKQQLNCLYQLQLLLKDPVRASMTCVKFYPLHCDNFEQLHANAQHLRAAHMHLQGELDLAHWEQQPQHRRSSVSSTASGCGLNSPGTCFAMQMDARSLNGHINTIKRQLELTKFLAQCEKENPTGPANVLKLLRADSPRTVLPTLFDGITEQIQLCILILLCGKNIDEGFGLAYGIMQDFKLGPMKVFGATAKYLARSQRLVEIDRLFNCVSSSGNGCCSSTADMDELLSIAINSAVNCHEPEIKQILDNLVKRISNLELRISSYIFVGQLKAAYLLANKYDRLADIRKILRQAEITNQIHIKKLCEKKLNLSSSNAPMATNATVIQK